MTYEQFRALLAHEPLPCALVDLDAVDANVELLLSRLGDGLTLRVASKSVRHVGLLRRLLERPRVRGLMTYSARETAFLAEQGFDDLFLAYPVARAPEARVLAELAAKGVELVVTVDCAEHVRLLGDAARAAKTTLRLSVDVDASWRPMGAHLGVRRSPVRSVEDALAVARSARDTAGVELVAVLGYEAQIAGMQDDNAGSRWLDPVRRAIKRGSKPAVKALRGAVVDALRREGFAIGLVNGGGTGSVAYTSTDPSVTEITVGSGFLCPHLFDGYRDLDLRPAAFFAIPVVRQSDAGLVTAAGGGFVASGEAGKSRLPVVHLPRDMRPLDMEGFGEVQTPLTQGTPAIGLGDPVICRHAKAGELMERFAEVLLVRGGEVVAREPTYRGLGGCFG
ncbi:MAG: amino acid deaminase/aldolase [Deltaproteobacteria bacterium]|nr:MAG: amino acid deaminase/aldolase [Deltaproteobacteria bacterium]